MSLERNRLIGYFISQLNLVNSDTRLLHIAPEKCLFDLFSKKLGKNYVPADKFEEGYSYPAGTRHIDITSMDIDDESFDTVICIHVLEHVVDDHKAISELYRVLKKGGCAILQVPYDAGREHTYEDSSITDPSERKKHFLQSDHVRIYGKDYLQRFIAPGFKIEYGNYVDTIPDEIKGKYVFKQEEIFLLRK
jgi:SAM-dependent methyltransferase